MPEILSKESNTERPEQPMADGEKLFVFSKEFSVKYPEKAGLSAIIYDYNSSEPDEVISRYERIVKFAKGHPEYRNYILFHLLIGSGLSRGQIVKMELDTGDHAIENFILGLKSSVSETLPPAKAA
ncbi:MAG: hypothetical protein ABI643_01825 [Candidatus Doudnabacteria bacterium]